VDHPTRRLDDVVHQRTRLGILTVLSEARSADFSTLCDVLDLTPGNLSRNLRVLEEHGCVRIEKTFENRRPRTWISATEEGLRMLQEEVAALREVIGRVDRNLVAGRAPVAEPRADAAPAG
jgi:DNA-binding MarR family transcriptional regulator